MPRYHIMADIADLNVLGDCINSISHYGRVEAVINSQKEPLIPQPEIEHQQTPFSEIVKQRNAEIIEKFKSGVNRGLLAQEYGLSPQTVYGITRWIKRDADILSPKQTPEISTRNAEIIAKYENGASSEELAEEYKITRERVCQILRRVNAIGKAQARKEAARIGYAEAAIKMKEQITQELETKINEIVELVRSGLSIRKALKQAGLPTHTHLANLVSKRANTLGIENRHGRHWDFSKRKEAIRALVNQGMPLNKIVAQLRLKDDPRINYKWIYDHMPELAKKNRRKLEESSK